MTRVGILSFSDGRKRVHESLRGYIEEMEDRVAKAFSEDEFEILRGAEIVWNASSARSEAERLRNAGVAAIVFNISVFAFPNYAVIAALCSGLPYLAIAPVNGNLPGLGGLLASVNFLRQSGIPCDKVWGNPEDPEVIARLTVFARAAGAASRLRGSVYGLFGGRSIGMGTGAANPDLWIRKFGVDTEHVDQMEIIRRAELVEPAEVEKGFKWLSERVGGIRYDGAKLTEESLKFQISCYIATKRLAEERGIDFLGVKCHYELSEYQVSQCVAADLMNDPWDWEGPKTPTVYSCEADSDGALTMHLMTLVSGKPALFVDFRHFDAKDGVFAFCNCGSFASWYAARSDSPEECLKGVTYHPLIPKYAGKGCHVQFLAKEGPLTLGRLTHAGDDYKLTLFRGRAVSMPSAKTQETCPQWPHAYVRVDCSPTELIDRYENNHVHGIPGDYVAELSKLCELLRIECEVIE